MRANVGKIDRLLRFLLGIAFIAAPFISSIDLFQSTVGMVVGIGVGAIMVVTSVTGFCPLYRIFGLRSSRA